MSTTRKPMKPTSTKPFDIMMKVRKPLKDWPSCMLNNMAIKVVCHFEDGYFEWFGDACSPAMLLMNAHCNMQRIVFYALRGKELIVLMKGGTQWQFQLL